MSSIKEMATSINVTNTPPNTTPVIAIHVKMPYFVDASIQVLAPDGQ